MKDGFRTDKFFDNFVSANLEVNKNFRGGVDIGRGSTTEYTHEKIMTNYNSVLLSSSKTNALLKFAIILLFFQLMKQTKPAVKGFLFIHIEN